MDNCCIATFKSITYAMQFEKIMKSNNIKFKLIPVPRSISASCGMCAKFDIYEKDNILELCNNNSIVYENIYDFE